MKVIELKIAPLISIYLYGFKVKNVGFVELAGHLLIKIWIPFQQKTQQLSSSG
ncbi:hypothetical protein [Flavobacterium sp. FlaQc-47]|uniref:hypothetical protein n=1 Tax=Flavobacterium sp. FlaQc-47 TaxID=3374180 RepID=UPI0037567ADC